VPLVQVLSEGDISNPHRPGLEGRPYRRLDSDDPALVVAVGVMAVANEVGDDGPGVGMTSQDEVAGVETPEDGWVASEGGSDLGEDGGRQHVQPAHLFPPRLHRGWIA
jgi:hypothetical protein